MQMQSRMRCANLAASACCRVPVTSAGVAAQLIQKATAARACEATAMNATSSRSHVVFMLYISGSHPPSETRLHGCLSLVDLAGRCAA